MTHKSVFYLYFYGKIVLGKEHILFFVEIVQHTSNILCNFAVAPHAGRVD